VPYRIHTVLTDNGIQFTTRARDVYDGDHIFDRVCDEHGIEHRLTKVNHPWTNGQVERMNRTLKDATVKRYHYASHDQLRAHLALFVDAYNHARRPKTLRGLTPYEFVCQTWTREPERFRLDPSHHIPGPYRYLLFASDHFCNGAFGVKPLTVRPRHGPSLLSVVGTVAATRSGQEERASPSRTRGPAARPATVVRTASPDPASP
jgi:hypothetical protein